MSITATGVSMDDVLDAALQSLSYSAWHDEHHSKDGRYCWHASELAGCPRKAILKRAQYPFTERDRDSAMLLAQAQMIHAWMEQHAVPAYVADPKNSAEVVVAEVGYRHPTLNLAAKPDLLLSKDSRLCLIDYKTEKEGAYKRRQEQARLAGQRSAARPEHQMQLTATAMVLEACKVVDQPIATGRIWYISRQEWWCDEQPVDLQDPLLREAVEERVAALDSAWADFERGRQLPHRLPAGSWMCQPRRDSPIGKYCEARMVCFDGRMPA